MSVKSSARKKLNSAIRKEQKKESFAGNVFSSKQEAEEGMFSSALMRKNELLKPPYDPYKLSSIAENSQVLPQCIDAMCKNVHGFGYEFDYTGDEEEASLPDNVMAEYKNLVNFFKKVNEEQSFVVMCMDIRRDIETTGNGYMEVIRDVSGGVALLYRADAKRVRLQRTLGEPVLIQVPMWRNGKIRDINIHKRFRKFSMLNGKEGQRTNLTWFKQYGDPRTMCKVSGKFEHELKDNETIIEEASELIHFKLGNGVYGIPRWSGQILISMGMQSAEYVNYDLFDNQVVPPLAILVSGGALTEESIDDITEVLIKKRGIENFNKVLILESQSDGTITERDSSKIELKELSAARKEDGMFTQYTEKGEGKIRTSFRFPPMISGRAESYSKSCYSEDTETLTDKGFKYYYDITDEDKIATYNPITERIEFHLPEGGLRLFDHDGDMIHFCSNEMDCLVTPNHDMWVYIHNEGSISGFRKIKAENLTNSISVSLNCDKELPEYSIDDFSRTIIFPTHINKVQYTGKVYCYNVPNHLFITRRNGKVTIQGNTAESSKKVAEEQVFVPERLVFDSTINSTIMTALKSEYWTFKSMGPRMIDGDNMAEIFNAFSRNGAFTINQAIRLANRLLNMDMTEYTNSDWANVPFAIVEQYAKLGLLEIDELNITSSVLDGLKTQIEDPKVDNGKGSGEKDQEGDDEEKDKKVEELKKVHSSLIHLSRAFSKLNEKEKADALKFTK